VNTTKQPNPLKTSQFDQSNALIFGTKLKVGRMKALVYDKPDSFPKVFDPFCVENDVAITHEAYRTIEKSLKRS